MRSHATAMNSPSLYWSRNDDKSHHIVVCIYNHQYEYEYDNINIHIVSYCAFYIYIYLSSCMVSDAGSF